jgi:phenylacetate-CoA ligase
MEPNLLSRLAKLVTIARGANAGLARARWSRARLEAYQQQRLDALVRTARARAPFFASLYAGLPEHGPVRLADLPITTKAMLMEDFDAAVTDPRLKRADVEALLARDEPGERLLGHYRVVSTGGSTGRYGWVVLSEDEWTARSIFSARTSLMSGHRPRPFRRPRICLIASSSRHHLSRAIFESTDPWVAERLSLGANVPLTEIARAVEAFQPEILTGYTSVVHRLALEQLAGRLRIAPRIVMTSAEVRTPEMAAVITRAWGQQPLDVYGASECFIGAECSERRGVHVFEDDCILEVVDGRGQAVPAGTTGERILLTALGSVTQPFIRYEMTDLVTLAPDPCPCGSSSWAAAPTTACSCPAQARLP